jgi:hypothetical protein
MEAVGAAAIGATAAREMNELILALNAAVIRDTETGAPVKCLSDRRVFSLQRLAF